MNAFVARRWRALFLTALFAMGVGVILTARSFSLRDDAYLSGWLLL